MSDSVTKWLFYFFVEPSNPEKMELKMGIMVIINYFNEVVIWSGYLIGYLGSFQSVIS